MSHILLIRHLPTTLSFQDKEQLLKHFGAEKVWETAKKRNYIFAAFENIEKAKASLGRLHQLKIANRRLVVEYSHDSETATQTSTNTEDSSTTTKLVKDFLRLLNAWNPSVDFYQPPPPQLKYKYPDITPSVAVNIIRALYTHKPFYVQTMHLMNKMCLDNPFEERPEAVEYFKETFKDYLPTPVVTVAAPPITIPPPLPLSESESEISSEENTEKDQVIPAITKRKNKLPVPSRKRPAVMPATIVTKTKKISQEEVFEAPPLLPKKISLKVSQDALQKPVSEPEVVGELGKFEKELQSQLTEEPTIATEKPIISKHELVKNRLSYRDMKLLPVFKNYHPGEPSMRLYIKNLAKNVNEQDLNRIYRRYVENMAEDEPIGYDVRVMQEGRMKGQAFVTFPSIEIAETALSETNGYLLKEKPMVVQFARAANKKTVD